MHGAIRHAQRHIHPERSTDGPWLGLRNDHTPHHPAHPERSTDGPWLGLRDDHDLTDTEGARLTTTTRRQLPHKSTRLPDSMGAGGLRPPSRHQGSSRHEREGVRGGNRPRDAPPGALGLHSTLGIDARARSRATSEQMPQTMHALEARPRRSRARHATSSPPRARLAAAARVLVVLLAASGGFVLESIAAQVGLDASRIELVHAYTEQTDPPGARLPQGHPDNRGARRTGGELRLRNDARRPELRACDRAVAFDGLPRVVDLPVAPLARPCDRAGCRAGSSRRSSCAG